MIIVEWSCKKKNPQLFSYTGTHERKVVCRCIIQIGLHKASYRPKARAVKTIRLSKAQPKVKLDG